MTERELNSSAPENLSNPGRFHSKLGIGVRAVLALGTIAAAVSFENKVDAGQDQNFIQQSVENEMKLGDVDCDGDIDSVDALHVLHKVAGLVDTLPCEESADVDGNKLINAVDTLHILRFVAGLIDHFPGEPTPTTSKSPTPTPTKTLITTPMPIDSLTPTPTRTPTPIRTPSPTPKETMSPDEKLIDKTEAQAARYFWDRALPNGFVRDTEFSQDASLAATGFGLSSLAVMAERSGENPNWVITHAQSEERAGLILDSALSYQSQQAANSPEFGKAGFLYHFLDDGGKKSGASEVSTVDMALFLSGALTAGQYFGGDIQIKANEVFNNVNWQYFLDSANDRFYHAWKPTCSPGFGVSAPDGDGCLSNQEWDRPTDEILLINLLALASDPNNAAFKRSLYAWPRAERNYADYNVVNSYYGSLFTYIYAHGYFDFERMNQDNPGGAGSTVQAVDWFENSWKAICANRQFAIDKSASFPTYGRNQWGLSAAYRTDGTYFGDMGAAPVEVDDGNPHHDGTIPPYGALSAFPILKDRPCNGEPAGSNLPLDALRNYNENHAGLWGKYGPKDSFKTEIVNGAPVTKYSPVYLGIDIGIEALMIENWRSGLINDLFMSHPKILEAVNIQFPDASGQ
ncbi:MAG: glucoamylase family protein [Patescibacteria group bacterium]